MGKKLKKIAKIAIPVAASFIPGLGPLGMAAAGALGGAVGGGGLKGALLGGALSGLGGAVFGGAPGTSGIGMLDRLNSSLYNAASPLRTIGGQIFGNATGSGTSTGGAAGSAAKGGATAAQQVASQAAPLSNPNNLPWLNDVAAGKLASSPYDLAGSVAKKGILGQLGDAISNPSFDDITKAMQLYGLTQDQTPAGTIDQSQILAQMQADKAKADANAQQFIASLNASPLQRVQTNPTIDYYSYGTRPEEKFFDSIEGSPTPFKAGGYASGGQEDDISAKLSAGEYVIPADVVSHLGDGNTEAGAKALDELLKKVRKTKAPAMKKGVLPPKAKSPLAYVGKVA